MSMHINNHALKSVERQRNAAGRLDSRFDGAARKWESSRVESRESIVAAGCWMFVWQMNRFESTNKWFMCIESIERIMWKLCSCPPACLPACKTDKVRFTFIGRSWTVWESLFVETQVQFIWGLVAPQSVQCGMGWYWQQRQLINSRLLRNYQLPILTHINQQIAVLWAKAEINWARDTNGYRNRRNRTETHKNTTRTTRGHEARLPEQRAEVAGARATESTS